MSACLTLCVQYWEAWHECWLFKNKCEMIYFDCVAFVGEHIYQIYWHVGTASDTRKIAIAAQQCLSCICMLFLLLVHLGCRSEFCWFSWNELMSLIMTTIDGKWHSDIRCEWGGFRAFDVPHFNQPTWVESQLHARYVTRKINNINAHTAVPVIVCEWHNVNVTTLIR